MLIMSDTGQSLTACLVSLPYRPVVPFPLPPIRFILLTPHPTSYVFNLPLGFSLWMTLPELTPDKKCQPLQGLCSVFLSGCLPLSFFQVCSFNFTHTGLSLKITPISLHCFRVIWPFHPAPFPSWVLTLMTRVAPQSFSPLPLPHSQHPWHRRLPHSCSANPLAGSETKFLPIYWHLRSDIDSNTTRI